MLKSFTLDDIMDLDPCWLRENIRDMIAHHGKETITALDVLDCDDVVPFDAVWLADFMLGYNGDKYLLAKRDAVEAVSDVLACGGDRLKVINNVVTRHRAALRRLAVEAAEATEATS